MLEHILKTSDLSIYEKNRDILYNELTKIGYSVVRPDGAFYLFVKSLEYSAANFSLEARKYELLLVPSDSFGCSGYVRISYCVDTDMINRSLSAFEKLYQSYKETK
jgi:aspartate aminotransferase